MRFLVHRRVARWLVLALTLSTFGVWALPRTVLAGGMTYYTVTVLPAPNGAADWSIGSGAIDDAGDIAGNHVDSGGFQHIWVWKFGSAAVAQPADYGLYAGLRHDGVFLYWKNSDASLHRYTIASGADTTIASVLSDIRDVNTATANTTVGAYFPDNSQIEAAGQAPLGSNNIHQITDLGFGSSGLAVAINDAGDVAGDGSCATSTQCAYFYDHASRTAVAIGPDTGNKNDTMSVSGLNAHGEVIGSFWSNAGFNQQPFTFTRAAGVTILGTGTASKGDASAINGAGDVVGQADGLGAVIWPGGSTTAVNLNTRLVPSTPPGLHLDRATGINDEGMIAASGTLADGSHRAFLLTPSPDGTPPTSTGVVVDGSGSPQSANLAGWYNASSLKLRLQVADDAGGLGLGSVTVVATGATQLNTTLPLARNGQTITPLTFAEGTTSVTYYATDLAGNEEAPRHTLIVSYDRTSPVVTCPSPPSDWQRGDQTITCWVNDAVSGLAPGTPSSLSLSTSVGPGAENAAAQTNAAQVCDQAGNCATAQLSGLKIDNKAPVIACQSPDGAWHAFDVTVSCAAKDDGSGLHDGAAASFTLTTSVPNGTADDNAVSGTREVCDAVGNCATAGPIAGFKVDKSQPIVTCDSADDAWHAADVAIHCAATDTGSGLATADDGSFTLMTSVPAGTETDQATTGSRNVCDAVGNCAAAGPVGGNRIDKQAPSITFGTPSGGSYVLHQSVTADYRCDDGGSGVAGCTGPVPDGGKLDTGSVGDKSFVVVATDQVGNASSRELDYSVGYGVKLLFNATKAKEPGSTIPVKLQLVDASGANFSSPSVTVTAVDVDGSTTRLATAGNANPDNRFRFDPSLGGYLLNLKTTGLSSGSHTLDFTVSGDSTVHSLTFAIK